MSFQEVWKKITSQKGSDKTKADVTDVPSDPSLSAPAAPAAATDATLSAPAAPAAATDATLSAPAASAAATMSSINASLRSRGGKYSGYSCVAVSWDDVSRGTVGGGLSCWGSNITDTYLKAKDGTPLYTVRSDNWNEKLGKVTASDVALVGGNHVRGGGALAPLTLRSFLENIGEHGAYAGLDVGSLADAALDRECSVRFQTTFLPVEGARGTLEFATDAYNYNTRDDADPRNLVLLCTSQGVAVQQDGAGAKRMFHHAVDGGGEVHRYWLEAERSEHKVGGAQAESAAEKADALARGKATASVIGTRAMGTRFNVLMTIQVPLQQKEKPAPRGFGPGFGAPGFGAPPPIFMSCGGGGGGGGAWGCDEGLMECSVFAAPPAPPCAAPIMMSARIVGSPKRRGVANAARVSRGSEHDVWSGLTVKSPARNKDEHVTITIVMYNTVAGGVPTEEDVAAAVDDLEQLYASCGADGRLADAKFDFMKKELTVKDTVDIAAKVVTQPYKPPPAAVANAGTFPN